MRPHTGAQPVPSHRRVFRSNQRLRHDLFFRCCAATLQKIGGLPKHLGDRLGFLGMLHTWNRMSEYHPHIHFLVAEAGLEDPGDRSPPRLRRSRSDKFFLPVKRLSINLRARMQRELEAADPDVHRRVPAGAWRAASPDRGQIPSRDFGECPATRAGRCEPGEVVCTYCEVGEQAKSL